MNPTVDRLILQDRRISCAVTDRRLIVTEVDDPAGACPGGWVGRPLSEVVPELVGSEDMLAAVLAGELPRLQLDWLNTEGLDGRVGYQTIVELPYRDDAGEVAGLIHVVQDMTEVGAFEQQALQQRNELRLLHNDLDRRNLELAAANTELQRLDEMKSSFVGIAAHELRTPLTAISGYLELLFDDTSIALTERQREYAGVLQESTERLLAITRDLLDLTRIQAGRLELTLMPVSLADLIQTIALEQRPAFEARTQRVTQNLAPDLPEALCDKIRAAQVIGNLLSNAAKYTLPGGAITVGLKRADQKGFLEVSVTDTGIGISAEDQERVFSPFFRAHNVDESGARGTGLGLPIARSLVELHGGHIWLESVPGQGSTFHVTFPTADAS